MKIALISPPAIRPMSPPLGPALLAGFVRADFPDTPVRCFDLNLLYYQEIIKYLGDGLNLRMYNWDPQETAGHVRRAADYLTSGVSALDPVEKYHHHATCFLSFENIANAFMAEMARRHLAGFQVPGLIETIFTGLVHNVLEFYPDVAGLSALFDCQMPFALLMASMLKKAGVPHVIMGGARFGVIPDPERLFLQPFSVTHKGDTRTVWVKDFIDAVAVGEGEPAIAAFAGSASLDMAGVPNLIIPEGSAPLRTGTSFIKDINTLPMPDFDDFPLNDYLTPDIVLPYLSARGCPWKKCTFCTHHRSYLKYRQLRIDRCVNDLARLAGRYGAKYFFFYDEMIPPGRFRRLARTIRASGLDIRYAAYAKPVKAFSPGLFSEIHASGCYMILWGIESGSQRILDLMAKGTMVETMRKVLNDAAGAGIRNLIFVMFGFPTETGEEFYATLRFLKDNSDAIHAVSKGLFLLIKGSEIADRPESFGIKAIKSFKADCLAVQRLGYEIQKGLSQQEVAEMYSQNLGKIESVGLSPRFGTYREHLLIRADHDPVNIRVKKIDRIKGWDKGGMLPLKTI